MPRCSVLSCKNNSKTQNYYNCGVTYHIYPKDPILKEQWINATGNAPNWFPTKTSTICSVHFTSDLFQPLAKSRRLFEWAVPTLKLRQIFTSDITNPDCITDGRVDLNLDTYSVLIENSSLKSTNDGSSITSPDTRSAVTLDVGGCSKSINDGCNMKSHDSRSAIPPIIAKVFIFLEREYEYMKTLNGDNCDLSPLADVLRRTAEATGFREHDVIMVMEKEGLADHLPGRVRRKRKKSCDYLCKLCGLEDDEMLERDNLHVTVEKEATSHAAISSQDDEMIEREKLNTTVEKETTGNAGYGHEALSSAPTYVFLTSDTEQTQVKVEPEDNEEMSVKSHNVLHETTLLGSNSAPTYVFLASDTEQTQVKVEPEDNEDATSHNVLHEIAPLGSNVEYFNQDEDDKMDIEQYTFTGTRPNDPPNPTASALENVEIKIEPADDL